MAGEKDLKDYLLTKIVHALSCSVSELVYKSKKTSPETKDIVLTKADGLVDNILCVPYEDASAPYKVFVDSLFWNCFLMSAFLGVSALRNLESSPCRKKIS